MQARRVDHTTVEGQRTRGIGAEAGQRSAVTHCTHKGGGHCGVHRQGVRAIERAAKGDGTTACAGQHSGCTQGDCAVISLRACGADGGAVEHRGTVERQACAAAESLVHRDDRRVHRDGACDVDQAVQGHVRQVARLAQRQTAECRVVGVVSCHRAGKAAGGLNRHRA